MDAIELLQNLRAQLVDVQLTLGNFSEEGESVPADVELTLAEMFADINTYLEGVECVENIERQQEEGSDDQDLQRFIIRDIAAAIDEDYTVGQTIEDLETAVRLGQEKLERLRAETAAVETTPDTISAAQAKLQHVRTEHGFSTRAEDQRPLKKTDFDRWLDATE